MVLSVVFFASLKVLGGEKSVESRDKVLIDKTVDR